MSCTYITIDCYIFAHSTTELSPKHDNKKAVLFLFYIYIFFIFFFWGGGGGVGGWGGGGGGVVQSGDIGGQ